jgi:hypothetical protein
MYEDKTTEALCAYEEALVRLSSKSNRLVAKLSTFNTYLQFYDKKVRLMAYGALMNNINVNDMLTMGLHPDIVLFVSNLTAMKSEIMVVVDIVFLSSNVLSDVKKRQSVGIDVKPGISGKVVRRVKTIFYDVS